LYLPLQESLTNTSINKKINRADSIMANAYTLISIAAQIKNGLKAIDAANHHGLIFSKVFFDIIEDI
jgi:hypothetical protein